MSKIKNTVIMVHDTPLHETLKYDTPVHWPDAGLTPAQRLMFAGCGDVDGYPSEYLT